MGQGFSVQPIRVMLSAMLMTVLCSVSGRFEATAANPDHSPARDDPPRPNVLFVMTDDQGFWDTGVTGNEHIDTPHMDSIARDGVQLTRYYAAPVCAPTRAGWMTGRYYLRTGLYNTRFGGDTLGRDETTVAECLQQAGYRTAMFGKWHLGKYPGHQPNDRGFDEFFGHFHGHIERYQFPDQVVHNGRPVDARGYVTDLFTDAAIDFIDDTVERSSQPFFCAVTYNAPHSPFLMDTSHYDQPAGDAGITKYLERGLPIREARIYALIERVDNNLGRLLGQLTALEIDRETLVVFTSDNGGVSKFFKAGLNGNKAGVYEGGVRAPCFIRWPGVIPAGTSHSSQTSHVDWMPTLCEITGATMPSDRPIDGVSLVPVLKSPATQLEHHQYVYHTWDRNTPNADRRWSISDQRWKLLCQIGSSTTPERRHWRLFDLEADPGETTNIAKKHPEIVQRLRDEFVRWFDDVTEGQRYRPIDIPVGDDAVELSPSWAAWHGPNVQYIFDGYDWDTIEAWKQPGESATWSLDVQQPGTFRVTLHYGCAPVDAGGMLSIEWTGDGLSKVIDHRVQPTATANQFDLFDAGLLQLPAGKCKLAAMVGSCSGRELMRLNRIELKRVE